MDPSKTIITINGHTLSPGHIVTIKVALESFAMDLKDSGLGDDQHGLTMTRLYLDRIAEIRSILRRKGD